MNIILAHILEPGAQHEIAVANKRGLYTALANAGHSVVEYDYLARPRVYLMDELTRLFEMFDPDLVISQLHGADVITPTQLTILRLVQPHTKWINWAGDAHKHTYLNPDMLALSRLFDWQLLPVPSLVPLLQAENVNAAYWQIGYEPPVRKLPDLPRHDIVFLGNAYSQQRRDMFAMLRGLPYDVGIYGDWEHADGHNTYDFAAGEALYQNAKLAIADHTKVDGLDYISNRPIQIMAAGGALCLHQRVDTMEAITGWKNGVHYIEWMDLDDLREKIVYWMRTETIITRDKMTIAAHKQVMKQHTFEARVRELFEKWV